MPPSRNMQTIERLRNRSNFDDLTSDQAHEASLAEYTEDFVVVEPPSLPQRGEHHGREQWLAMHEIMRATWQQKLTVEHAWDVPEHDVVVLYSRMDWTAKETGRSATWPTVQVFHFRDAKICKVEVFHQDTKVILDTLEPTGAAGGGEH